MSSYIAMQPAMRSRERKRAQKAELHRFLSYCRLRDVRLDRNDDGGGGDVVKQFSTLPIFSSVAASRREQPLQPQG